MIVKFRSAYNKERLTISWDQYTNEARFAGGDDFLDLVFIAKRKGNKISLIKKSKIGASPFTTRFNGVIKDDYGTGVIEGKFSKGLADYIAALLFVLFYSYIVYSLYQREQLISVLLFALGGLIMFLLLKCSKKSKQIYIDFINRTVEKP